ncbi:MAG: chloride channel protein [Actinobacteria bacterium]|nr:chloride channel protein [Actinomycetota bacterium]
MDMTGAVRSREFWRVLLLSAVVGIPVSIAALAFVYLFTSGIDLIWYDLPAWLGLDEPPWWLVIVVPTLGGLLVAGTRRLSGDGGHSPLRGFSGGPTRPQYLPSVLLAMLVTLCSGLVLGHEAPLMAIGTGLAVLMMTAAAKQDMNARQAFAIAGAAAALSVLFGNPIVAVVLLLEAMGLGGPQRSLFLFPALLSSGIGYLVFTGIGWFTGFNQPVLAVPDPPQSGPLTFVDVGWTLVLAPAAAAVLLLIRAAAFQLQNRTRRSKPWIVIPIAGLAVALLALCYSWVTGADPRNVLFSGQSAIPGLAGQGMDIGVSVLVALLLCKGLAFAVSLGGGFRGGPIFPSLFLGGLIGMIGAQLLPGISPAAAFYVGMAAATAASLQIPLGSILLVALLGGAVGIQLLPLIICAAVIGSLLRAAADLSPLRAAAADPAPEPPRVLA